MRSYNNREVQFEPMKPTQGYNIQKRTTRGEAISLYARRPEPQHTRVQHADDAITHHAPPFGHSTPHHAIRTYPVNVACAFPLAESFCLETACGHRVPRREAPRAKTLDLYSCVHGPTCPYRWRRACPIRVYFSFYRGLTKPFLRSTCTRLNATCPMCAVACLSLTMGFGTPLQA